jgi:hypothetical protein
MGQAAYERDDLPAAIAAFRQGLAQSPTHPQFRAALEECRATVSYPEGITPPTLDRWQHWLSPGDLLLLGCLCAVMVIAGWVLLTLSRPWGWAVLVLGSFGWLMLGYASFIIHNEQAHDLAQPVRVVQFECPVSQGNSQNYPTRLGSPLSAGAEVRVVHTRGAWVQIELDGQAKGWLPTQALVPVVPVVE